MDGFIKKKEHRHVKEIPLAPVLDLLVVVIFFLILSSSFVELTKQTLPPSATSSSVASASDPAPPPLNPKLFTVKQAGVYRMILLWTGKEPGQEEAKVPAQADLDQVSKELESAAGRLTKDFKKKYPTQSSLQMGLSADVDYQNMISIMDGARENLQDIVLVSYRDTKSIAEAR